MKVLVAAPYPTMGGMAATQTADLVSALVAGGEEVEVASPMVSAAHHVADLGGVRGALTLARLARRFDRVIVRLDATAFGADAAPPRLIPARLALAAALRRARSVEMQLDRLPARVDRQFARLILASAREVTVAGGEDAAALGRAGIDSNRIRLSDPPRSAAPPASAAGPWRLSVRAESPGGASGRPRPSGRCAHRRRWPDWRTRTQAFL